MLSAPTVGADPQEVIDAVVPVSSLLQRLRGSKAHTIIQSYLERGLVMARWIVAICSTEVVVVVVCGGGSVVSPGLAAVQITVHPVSAAVW